MYGTPGGEIPSVGKVELSWIQSAAPPPVTPITPTPASAKRGEDTSMAMDEGDAMAQVSTPARAREQQESSSRNLDYEVADDNEWGVQ
jgi:hypothetical protein